MSSNVILLLSLGLLLASVIVLVEQFRCSQRGVEDFDEGNMKVFIEYVGGPRDGYKEIASYTHLPDTITYSFYPLDHIYERRGKSVKYDYKTSVSHVVLENEK